MEGIQYFSQLTAQFLIENTTVMVFIQKMEYYNITVIFENIIGNTVI